MNSLFLLLALQSFGDLVHKPLLVDLTVEEGQRLKVIYGSCAGFHAVDVDSGSVYDIYLPTHVRTQISHCVVFHNPFCITKRVRCMFKLYSYVKGSCSYVPRMSFH